MSVRFLEVVVVVLVVLEVVLVVLGVVLVVPEVGPTEVGPSIQL